LLFLHCHAPAQEGAIGGSGAFGTAPLSLDVGFAPFQN
jgi:hypothetical protein